jgi:SH3-like domain-containing protein
VPTATSAPLATETATPPPPTAVVSSGVGVYLRAEPSTESEQLQYLEQGVTVVLLEGQQTTEELLWQQVQAADGQVGWVAFDFITPLLPPGS